MNYGFQQTYQLLGVRSSSLSVPYMRGRKMLHACIFTTSAAAMITNHYDIYHLLETSRFIAQLAVNLDCRLSAYQAVNFDCSLSLSLSPDEKDRNLRIVTHGCITHAACFSMMQRVLQDEERHSQVTKLRIPVLDTLCIVHLQFTRVNELQVS